MSVRRVVEKVNIPTGYVVVLFENQQYTCEYRGHNRKLIDMHHCDTYAETLEVVDELGMIPARELA